MSESRDSSAYKLFESPEVAEEPSERKFFFEDFYSHQGVTEKTSMALVNKLNKVKTGELELKNIDSLLEEELKIYNDLGKALTERSEEYSKKRKDGRTNGLHTKDLLQEKKIDKLRARRRRKAESISRYYEHGQLPASESFYATSSDSLEVLKKVDVQDQRVATVAGSSDFWQIFADSGAAEIDIFDISLPAIFYAELKLVGLETLSFEDYLKMFGKSRDDLQSRGANFFDWDIYKKVREKLSSQAKIYFDGLQKHKDVIFGNVRDRWYGDFVRFRKKESFIGGTISTTEDYEKLKSKSKKIKYRFFLKDINNDPGSEEIVSSDVVYLSNINYNFRDSLELAEKIILGGARKVITATSENSLTGEIKHISKEKITEGSSLGMFGEVWVTILGIGKERDVGHIILEIVID